MSETLEILSQYGYLVLFAFVLAEQIGLPIPAVPVLLGVGALTGAGRIRLRLAELAKEASVLKLDVMLTGEDLCNLGPIALLQDLALMSLLGIDHVERNGHHYYRGLSMFPSEWQKAVLAEHGDVYACHEQNFVCVQINEGKLKLGSVNRAPFGIRPLLDPSVFAPQPMPKR